MATVFSIVFFTVSLAYKSVSFCVKNHGYGKRHAKCGSFSISMDSLTHFQRLHFRQSDCIIRISKKRKLVTFYGIFLRFILVTIPGITGYLIFGENTDGNILKNFDSNDVLMIICRCGFFVIVSCAYPMVSQSVMSMWGGLMITLRHCLDGEELSFCFLTMRFHLFSQCSCQQQSQFCQLAAL